MPKTSTPLNVAQGYADTVINTLAPFCERIEVAGSVRRQKAEVGDLEIVAIPKMIDTLNLFGDIVGAQSQLDLFNFELFGRVIKGGSRYKQIEMRVGINLDLFLVLLPAQWGVIFLIRTGSADFSRMMVTQKVKGGYLPSDCRVKDGAIWRGETMLSTPEESDFFNLCGMDVVPPEKR